MYLIKDYLEIKGNSTFEEFPLNNIDFLILTEFCYSFISKSPLFNEENKKRFIKLADFNNETVFDKIERKKSSIKKEFNEFIRNFINSKRYQEFEIGFFEECFSKKKETQYFAATFRLNKDYFIIFRGTDNSIIGWKEDFNMSFMDNIYSQELAKKYSKKIISKFKGNFYISGHSKGGNLAIYSYFNLPKRSKKKVINIFNFDGPGFRNEDFDLSDPKIKKFILKDDYIGVLMDTFKNYKIIKSSKINLGGHNALTWEINKELNDFEYAEECTIYSYVFEKTINNWYTKYSQEELRDSVSLIFNFIETDNISQMNMLIKSILDNPDIYIKNISSFDPNIKEKTKIILKEFISMYLTNFKEEVKKRTIISKINIKNIHI